MAFQASLCVVGSVFIATAAKADAQNLALGRETFSSSANHHPSSVLVDGSSETNWYTGSCFATTHGDMDPWWMVDLGDYYEVTGFKVLNRADCCPERLSNFTAEVLFGNPENIPDTPRRRCHHYVGSVASAATATVKCDVAVMGRYFRISRYIKVSTDALQLCEVEIYGVKMKSSCSRFIATMNYQMPSNESIIVDSPANCADTCFKDKNCFGFNFRWSGTRQCQTVSDLSHQLSLSQGWKYFSIRNC